MEVRGTGQFQAIAAGFCAASASVFAKLAVVSEKVPELCDSVLRLMSGADSLVSKTTVDDVVNATSADTRLTADGNDSSICASAAICLRILCFGLVFVFNAIMWTLFVKSLQRTSSLVATVTNSAANFFFTAVTGWLLFGENLPLTWWIGASLVVAGLVLINWESKQSTSTIKDKNKTD